MDLIEAVAERRSINYFEQNQKIPKSKMEELFHLANLAPSSFNLQPWRVIVVDDPVRKSLLRKCAFDQPKVEEAPVVLILIADPEALEDNHQRILDNWQDLGYIKDEKQKQLYKEMMFQLYGAKESLQRKLFAIKNTALFAMNLMLTARGLGLETHAMDGFDVSCVKKEFSIPEDKIIPMLIAVGRLKTGQTLLPRALRRSINEFVTYNYY